MKKREDIFLSVFSIFESLGRKTDSCELAVQSCSPTVTGVTAAQCSSDRKKHSQWKERKNCSTGSKTVASMATVPKTIIPGTGLRQYPYISLPQKEPVCTWQCQDTPMISHSLITYTS